MTKKDSFSLLLNYENSLHSEAIKKMLKRSEHVDVIVAFLKNSGLAEIKGALLEHLKAGRSARFVVGIDFFITDAEALMFLLKNSARYRLDAFVVNNCSSSFHMKVYAFTSPNSSWLIVGSANLTYGGIAGNYEASILLSDPMGKHKQIVENMIEELVNNNEASRIDSKFVNSYRHEANIHQELIKLARTKARRLAKSESLPLAILQDRLNEMKADESINGFDQQRARRAGLRSEANLALSRLEDSSSTEADFLQSYKELIEKWNSTGNLRSSGSVSQNAHLVKRAIKLARESAGADVAFVFDRMVSALGEVKGFGVNAITETLCTIDNQKFAVMNQNSVEGLALGSSMKIPSPLSKKLITGDLYQKFCHEMRRIQDYLKLSNFSELDSLFSYIYFS